MKFASFQHNGNERIGLVNPETETIQVVEASDMVDLIRRFENPKAVRLTGLPKLHFKDVTLIAPIPHPKRNIFCVGKNYHAHAREFSQSGYEAGAVKGTESDPFPAVFTKPASSVVGPGADVETHPSITSEVDYEAELAVVIGCRGRNIARSEALSYVWGYTIINDVTARDRQKQHRQWFLGKALDTFCPMGPWITTADEVDSSQLDVRCWVNGELRQNANTSDLIFDIPSLIATISGGLTLEPGDVIATGTPAGVGIGFNPPRFLKAGDTVTVEIEGLGSLTNRFV